MDGDVRHREAIGLLVILLHVAALIALLMWRIGSLPSRPGALSTLSLYPVDETPAPRTSPPRETRRAGGSPAAGVAGQALDTSRQPVANAFQVAPSDSVEPVSAGAGGAASQSGSGGAGVGDGSGVGDGTSARDGVGIADRSGGTALTRGPAWIRRISDAQLLPLLGGKIRRHGVSVSLTLSCEIMLTQQVRNCRVLDETPPDTGVAAAVPEASRYFRIAPALHDGRAIDGERVTILWQVDLLPVRRITVDPPLAFG